MTLISRHYRPGDEGELLAKLRAVGKVGFVLGDDEYLARHTHPSAYVNGFEPELMHKMVERSLGGSTYGAICTRMADLLDGLLRVRARMAK